MAEAAWTEWSSFKELRVEFDNPAQPDSVTEHNWQDSWFLALGATYRPRENLTLRVGVAYDQAPVREAYSTPRIPDGDRTWLSFGVGWTPIPWLSLDAALTHLFVEDTAVACRPPIRQRQPWQPRCRLRIRDRPRRLLSPCPLLSLCPRPASGAVPKAALVTGAAKRLGRAMALGLAEDGWDIAIHCNGSLAEAEQAAGRPAASAAVRL